MKYVQGSILTEKAGKLFKKADRIFCSVKEDRIYITDGYILFNLSSPEYDAFFRPVIGYDPGNWIIEQGEKREDKKDFTQFFEKDSFAAQKAPFVFTADKKTVCGFYGQEKEEYTFINADWIASFTKEARFFLIGETAGLYAVNDEMMITALLLPIRYQYASVAKKAIKAYFNPEETKEQKEDRKDRKIARLEEELKEKDQMIEDYHNELMEKAAELAATREAAQKEEVPKKKSPADIAAALMKYGKVTIKGENTEKPIVWVVSGKENREALKAAGAKWSMKKSAWYVCA